MKSAAAAWLRNRDLRADFAFTQPEGAPIGSVVDIQFQHRGLRVHLDQAVEPAWDVEGHEPVLGVSVPVDRDTLIDRWYVHRIGLHSEGTSRRVRIGTEAFARETEWFALDDCEMTKRGLSTPAVEQIVRSRSSRPVTQWGVAKVRKVLDPRTRAQVLLRKLADAIRVESALVVARVCRDIADLTGVEGETRAQLAAAVADAERWLEGQVQVRRELFSRLEAAVATRDALEVRQLLARVNATASHDRTPTEVTAAAVAAEYLAEQRQAYAEQLQAEAAARLSEQQDARARRAADRVQTLLSTLQRRRADQSLKMMRKLVRELMHAAADAGDRVDADQQKQISVWKTRADIGRPPAQTPRQTSTPIQRTPQPKRKPPLHEQVGRRSWFKKPCPRCRAAKGRGCLNDDRVGNGSLRQLPHDERLQLIIGDRKTVTEQSTQRPSPNQSRQPRSPSWNVLDVACPTCRATPGSRCEAPDGPHQPRVTRFKRRFPSR